MAQNPTITQLDPGQIVKRVYDESNDRIRVDAAITAPDGTSILIDATTDSIKIGNTATGPFLNVNPDGSINIEGAVTGTFTPSGLRTKGQVTTLNITSTASAIPATPLTKRNALSLTNLSAFTLFIGYTTSVTADRSIGTNAGWEVGPNEGFSVDITDSIQIYGIAESGNTILVKVMELS